MSKLLSALIAAACLSVALPALAADVPSRTERAKLMAMDDDKDGVVSLEEYNKHKGDAKAWSAMDLNNNGRLDPDELAYEGKSNVEKTAPQTQ